ncbi:hypothetical protein ACFFV7_44595 [Nonomuraea spiralis]|uniref:Carbohydrate-binding domain-containing protein n=1 Tax=Nonomuraea spiralis TaxID=46182 RepID=A0ABV5IWP6_9ACTN|nr:hypothetical protein [Nonomuraea spiralis]GGT45638.1 hypothetical protein GCM10010176_106020 [Nonomuraea spiralis]
MKITLRSVAAACAATLAAGLLAALPAQSASAAAAATAVLGADPVYTGIVKAWPGDGDKDPAHAVSERGGESCWQMSGTPYNRYVYVDVADASIPAGATRAWVVVRYFDAGPVGLDVHYDGKAGAFTGSGNVALTGTGTWKSSVIALGDITFRNRANGADFRLNVKADAASMPGVCFSKVEVHFTDPSQLTITNPSLVFTQGTNTIDVAAAADKVEWTIGDPNGVPLKSGTLAVANGTMKIDISDLGPGYYRLTVSTGFTTRSTSFGVITPNATKDPYFSAAIHYGWQKDTEEQLLKTAARIGWTEVRSDANWSGIEKQAGVYDFTASLDSGLRKAYENGITTMPILGYRNPLYDGGKTPSTPAGLAAFARFGAATAANYAPFTKDFSIYNEYNSTGFNDGACGITPQCYLDVVKALYPAIHQAVPTVNVVGPTSAGTQLAWHDQFFALGGLDYLDTLSVNFYGYADAGAGTPPERTVMTTEFPQLVAKVKAKKNMPIWISENGWPTHTAGSTEAQQADYLIRAQTLARSAGADKYFWYDLIDDGDNAGEREHRFGLFRRPAPGVAAPSPKPAAVSQAVLIRKLAGRTLGARQNVGDADVYSYPISGGTRLLWATQPRPVTLAALGDVTLTDQFGAVSTLRPQAGKVRLDLDGSPVFVSGLIASVKAGASPLSVSAPEQSVTGEKLAVTVTADRTGGAKLPGRLAVAAGEVKADLVTRKGRKTSVTLELPATPATGRRAVTATVADDRGPIARLRSGSQVVKPYTVKGRPIIVGKKLQVTVTNNSPATPVKLSSVGWQVGSWRGVVADPAEVPALGSVSVEAPVPDALPYVNYSYAVTAGNASDTGSLSFSPIEKAGATTLDPIDLDGLGRWVGLRGGTRTGPDDLSGTIRFTHSPDALILDAVIKDDVHNAARTDPSLNWQVDSVQFNLYSAFPGELTGERVEVGAALLPSGPAAYTWTSPAGPTPGADVAITRDETAKTTTYRLAVPWASLGYDKPPTGVIGISFLVNDADAGTGGDARDGYLEWGGGVGAAPKNPALFRSAQLV